MKKVKIDKKIHRIIVSVLVALGGYVAGVVSEKNPDAGKVIKEVVTVIGSVAVADTIN